MLGYLTSHPIVVLLLYIWAASTGFTTAGAQYDMPLSELFELYWRESALHISVGLFVIFSGMFQLLMASLYAQRGQLRVVWWSRTVGAFQLGLAMHALACGLFMLLIWLSAAASTSALNYGVPQRLLLPVIGFSYLYLIVLLVVEEPEQ